MASVNNPVFTIGTTTAAATTPTNGLPIFRNSCATAPPTKPAAVPFARQTSTVSNGLTFQRMLPPTSQPKMQATETTTPNTNPRIAPSRAPNSTPPITSGISTNDKLNVPIFTP